MEKQDSIFLKTESDAWFARNKAALKTWNPETDLPLRLLSLYDLKPKRVIEIGASCGFRVAHVAKKYGAEGYAVEPSKEAIAFGQQQFPDIHFDSGLASNVPVDGIFDLVIVNFVLHWIDRSTVMSSISEIDRLVAENGFLLLGDFLPGAPCRVKYHHRPDETVFTYKQDYSAICTRAGSYQVIAQLTTVHTAQTLSASANDGNRIHASLLRKDTAASYPESCIS